MIGDQIEKFIFEEDYCGLKKYMYEILRRYKKSPRIKEELKQWMDKATVKEIVKVLHCS
jgi:hypothetical protein